MKKKKTEEIRIKNEKIMKEIEKLKSENFIFSIDISQIYFLIFIYYRT